MWTFGDQAEAELHPPAYELVNMLPGATRMKAPRLVCGDCGKSFAIQLDSVQVCVDVGVGRYACLRTELIHAQGNKLERWHNNQQRWR